MPVDDERVAVALRALRASGDDRAASVVQAILGDGEPQPNAAPPAPAAGAPAAAPAVPEQVQQLGAQLTAGVPAGTPPGALTIADVKRMTEQEVIDRIDDVNAAMERGV